MHNNMPPAIFRQQAANKFVIFFVVWLCNFQPRFRARILKDDIAESV